MLVLLVVVSNNETGKFFKLLSERKKEKGRKDVKCAVNEGYPLSKKGKPIIALII